MTRARKNVGRVTFVGAGPGDPGLLTVHAVEVVRAADVVFADAEVAATVAELAGVEVRAVEAVPAETAKLLLAEARNGLSVARLVAGDPFAETIERATRYVEAGADCIFVPGVDDADTIRRLAAEIPAPINIVAGLTATLLDAPTLFSLGVARISLGGSIARAALSVVERAGRELLETGTLRFLDGAISYADLQRRFTP